MDNVPVVLLLMGDATDRLWYLLRRRRHHARSPIIAGAGEPQPCPLSPVGTADALRFECRLSPLLGAGSG